MAICFVCDENQQARIKNHGGYDRRNLICLVFREKSGNGLNMRIYRIASSCLIFVILVGCSPQNHRRGIYDRDSVRIESGQMAKITHPAGVALVEFTSYRPDGASYRWRFLNNSNQLESAGIGEVRDTSKKIFANVSYQSCTDTNFYVRAGSLWIAWSYGGTSSASLYYVKGRTKVELLSSLEFQSVQLVNHEGVRPNISN